MRKPRGITFSPDPEAAKNLVKWLAREDNYTDWLNAADAYYAPFLKKFDTHPMWDKEPKFKPFKDSLPTSHAPGWPAANSRAAAESLAKYVLVNMYQNAAKGMSTKEAVTTATNQLKEIYGKA